MQTGTVPEAVMVPRNPETFEDEDQQDGEEKNGKAPKRQKSRHRASVACATCRERRIRVGNAAGAVGRSC